MIATTLLVTLAAGLTSGSPIASNINVPPKSQASAFSLIANVTDTAKAAALFGTNPPIQHTYLTFISSDDGGLNPATLFPVTRSGFFVNGTASSSSINMPPQQDSNGDFVPRGLQFLADGSFGQDAGFPTVGAGIRGGRSLYPVAYGPGRRQFVVCNELVTGGLARAVKWIGGEVPANCVAINLLAGCNEFPEGAITEEAKAALNLGIQTVDCYENVSEIDWTQY
ncbi:hypothetical protein QBC38DRAFT_363052 [Podospora fimiseda]|uniref:DUF7907 domain-containing protein n=1 Tax=Podospora fimiseda TaxID=252190 RepID=A0AAN7GZR7_9PEZI|nr:hypothetical protein QBC38DRAFT_363052 [Podospora fimiseda]